MNYTDCLYSLHVLCTAEPLKAVEASWVGCVDRQSDPLCVCLAAFAKSQIPLISSLDLSFHRMHFELDY